MFIEPYLNSDPGQPGSGWIEVICGPMFSGKTEELIRRVRRAVIAGQAVKIFKPAIDTRYHEMHVVSHNRSQLDSVSVENAQQILELYEGAQVVGIDEAQFFDDGLIAVCNQLANNGHRVVISGLDMDYEGNPFGPMPQLLCIAEFVTKLHAICPQTGELASFSFRLNNADAKVLLGEKDVYEPRSRRAFVKGMQAKKQQ